MVVISKVYFGGGSTSLNSIATNRIVSTFKIIGGPREPGYIYYILDDDTGNYVPLNLKPQYLGQVMYSNTVEASYTPIKNKARLFLAVQNTSTASPSNFFEPNELKWVPIINYYAEFYIDPSTGKPWDPVAGYVCDPPYLCPENP